MGGPFDGETSERVERDQRGGTADSAAVPFDADGKLLVGEPPEESLDEMYEDVKQQPTMYEEDRSKHLQAGVDFAGEQVQGGEYSYSADEDRLNIVDEEDKHMQAGVDFAGEQMQGGEYSYSAEDMLNIMDEGADEIDEGDGGEQEDSLDMPYSAQDMLNADDMGEEPYSAQDMLNADDMGEEPYSAQDMLNADDVGENFEVDEEMSPYMLPSEVDEEMSPYMLPSEIDEEMSPYILPLSDDSQVGGEIGEEVRGLVAGGKTPGPGLALGSMLSVSGPDLFHCVDPRCYASCCLSLVTLSFLTPALPESWLDPFHQVRRWSPKGDGRC